MPPSNTNGTTLLLFCRRESQPGERTANSDSFSFSSRACLQKPPHSLHNLQSQPSASPFQSHWLLTSVTLFSFLRFCSFNIPRYPPLHFSVSLSEFRPRSGPHMHTDTHTDRWHAHTDTITHHYTTRRQLLTHQPFPHSPIASILLWTPFSKSVFPCWGNLLAQVPVWNSLLHHSSSLKSR